MHYDCNSLLLFQHIMGVVNTEKRGIMKKEKKKGSCLKTILTIFAIFIILCIIGSVFDGSDEKTAESDMQTADPAENNPTENDGEEKPNETETENPPSEMPSNSNEETEEYSSLSGIELDELQQLYLNFDSSLSYSDAVNYIINTGLPYSEEKYNGSRTIQVAFTEGCTAQKYMKESGDFLTITYVYPKDENSINDELDKYNFGTCCYVPSDSDLQLIEHKNGYYYSYNKSGNYISKLGNDLGLDTSMSKEEQMQYYFNNK